MNTELRNNLRLRLLESIHEYASPKLQSCWVTYHEDICVSYTECACGYFDDLNLDGGLEKAVEEGWITLEESSILTEFHTIADSFEPKSNDNQEIINDPQWTRVVNVARKTWLKLKNSIRNTNELKYMDSLEKKWGVIE